jgi:hypothetical protein
VNDDIALEHRLASAYAVAPADGFVSTDRRIASLTADAAASRRPRPWRRLRVGLALAAAFVVLAGAAAAAINLLDRVATSTAGTAVAWDQGVEINQRQVHDGYAVTLARGYADINQVVLGVSVERVGDRDRLDLGLVTELRDPAGVVLGSADGVSFGANDANGWAEMLNFGPATSSDGEYTLRLGLTATGGQPDMAWTFRFSLPTPAGAIVQVDQTQTTAQASVDLMEVRLSPTMITASIHLEPSDREASAWAAIGYVKHGEQTIRIDWGVRRGPTDLDQTAGTYEGIDDPAGAWTLVITELVGLRPDGTQVRLEGPWEFAFSAP